MRVIEKQMCDAIREGRDMTKGGVAVRHDPVIGGVEVEVFQHGRLIAKRFFQGVDKPGKWEFMLCWNAPSYRSRINALCEAFAPGNWVHVRNGKPWFAGREINLDEWVQA